jgi:2-oxoisovalerate dehydrogenase E2 component (dihydrolipoyl transacylase)
VSQFNFKLPDIGEGTTEAEIAEWRVGIGDQVEEDQPLVDMMTDKATVELTSPVRGKVLALSGSAGEKTAVGAVLVTFEVSDASAAATEEPALVASAAPAAATKPLALSANESVDAAPVQPAGEIKPPVRATAAPAVRRRAADLGIDLPSVRGSGPDGRVIHADLDAHISKHPSEAKAAAPRVAAADNHYARRSGVDEIPVTGLRRQIAERMQLAKRQIPHFSYIEEVDVTELESLRTSLNAANAGQRPKLTLLPFLMRALVRALPEFPQINATYDDEGGFVKRHAPVHIGIATQTSKGLLVTVVRHAEERDVWNAAAEVARLSAKAREGKATREDLSGSTITITSLGALGGVATTPVINRPEVAIVGPNRIVERPVVRDGAIVVRKMMNVSSSFDHRVVDGADAAEFIRRVRSLLECPATLFTD